jgi:FtsZ-binding cell division protein ZapB
MDTLNQLEEKVMLAIQKIGLLKEENTRLKATLEQARGSIKELEAEKAQISAEIQRADGLRQENEALKKDRQDFKDRVERIIEKVEVLSDIVIEDENAQDEDEGTTTDSFNGETNFDISVENDSDEEETAMPLYGGEDSQL